ncbi:MAG: photosystem II assembly protein [Tolypothrix carrinoi HA7290-LM1]|jgi:SAM-dependent methyltransferase|nr:photosystem II assembly protein [Tolypothrix carrinoi HA7290-LM1]
MSNAIANWWRSQQFKSALKRGNTQVARKLLQEIKKSGAKFSWLEKLFRDKLQLESYSQQDKREVANLSFKLTEALQKLENLNTEVAFEKQDSFLFKPEAEFINFVSKAFKLIEHDVNKLQSTSLDERIFDDFEARLVEYIKEEFSRIPDNKLKIKIEDALEDINSLKSGQDPDYRFSLTPHVYFMKYFLENVYCIYLAWFLIYKAGLLPNKINILDIAAGPGTVAYGLALFLQSTSGFFDIQQMHISYYSLEKQDAFQFRGLQFWRRYIESRKTPVNAYFRFVTDDIFTWNSQSSNIPKDFFDFITVSHCFFNTPVKSLQANNIYKQIFATRLKPQGYVLLVVQDKKLFKAYDAYQVEDQEQEKKVVNKFLAELGLELVWYKYLTSTGSRTPYSAVEFGKFALAKLPKQLYMSSMIQKYLGHKYEQHYSLDDYVILAKKY